jgi:hypothetical protein
MAERIDRGSKIKHDSALEPSYGAWIPEPSTVKGNIVVLGELAGSTDKAKTLVPERHITFDDSVNDNRRNQPRSH